VEHEKPHPNKMKVVTSSKQTILEQTNKQTEKRLKHTDSSQCRDSALCFVFWNNAHNNISVPTTVLPSRFASRMADWSAICAFSDSSASPKSSSGLQGFGKGGHPSRCAQDSVVGLGGIDAEWVQRDGVICLFVCSEVRWCFERGGVVCVFVCHVVKGGGWGGGGGIAPDTPLGHAQISVWVFACFWHEHGEEQVFRADVFMTHQTRLRVVVCEDDDDGECGGVGGGGGGAVIKLAIVTVVAVVCGGGGGGSGGSGGSGGGLWWREWRKINNISGTCSSELTSLSLPETNV
jgi:hypothetical protein